MTDKKCDGNCCDSCLDDYDEIEQDYEIQRLKDIIEICEYLIQVRTHKIEKRKIIDDLCDNNKKDDQNTRIIHRIYPYTYPDPYRYSRKAVPWWDRVWF